MLNKQGHRVNDENAKEQEASAIQIDQSDIGGHANRANLDPVVLTGL